MSDMVIGTFAYCGSGQDTLADSFCRYRNYKKYSMGDVFRMIACKRQLVPTRDVLQMLRVEYDKKYGRTFAPEQILEIIQRDNYNRIIITGIRTMEEYHIFKNKLDLRLIFVYTEPRTRFIRMLRRGEKKDCNTVYELRCKMEKENELFDYCKLEEVADIKFDFGMNIQEYRESEQEILRDLEERIYKLYVENKR